MQYNNDNNREETEKKPTFSKFTQCLIIIFVGFMIMSILGFFSNLGNDIDHSTSSNSSSSYNSNSNSSSSSSNKRSRTCPICGRSFTEGSSDYRNIGYANMCDNCERNYHLAVGD